MAKKWKGFFDFVHRDKDGKVVWEAKDCPNALADEGESDVLDVFFRGTAAQTPASFEIGLFNDTPVETDGVADLTGEPSTNGYARQTLARSAVGFPTLALDSGDYMVTAATKTFSASGGAWGPVTYGALISVLPSESKRLIAFAALSQSRTLADGETLDVIYKVKLS